jgi:phosphoribosylcarboxyaminoimidazole (NCAIR) mutase
MGTWFVDRVLPSVTSAALVAVAVLAWHRAKIMPWIRRLTEQQTEVINATAQEIADAQTQQLTGRKPNGQFAPRSKP